MIKDKRVLAVIPARGGSKGFPGKNIARLNGKRVLEYSVESAKKSSYIDDLILSTDSVEISQIGEELGISVPFLRPSYLAKDTSETVDVLIHAIEFMQKSKNIEYDFVILLEPTSPLREACDIDRALEILSQSSYAKSIVSVANTGRLNPAFLVYQSSKNVLMPYVVESLKHKRRQEIEEIYFLEGTIYISEVKTLMEEKSFYHKKTIGFEVPEWKAYELDSELDFVIITAILEWQRRLK